jgi:hypothetical protein
LWVGGAAARVGRSLARLLCCPAQLATNTAERNFGTRTRQPSPLAGMLFDGDGNPMTPTHATKKGEAVPLLCFPKILPDRPTLQ